MVCGFVDCTEGLNEEWKGAVFWDHFCDALYDPGCKFWAQGNFGGLISLPTGVVWASRVA